MASKAKGMKRLEARVERLEMLAATPDTPAY
jgi:hypothetical protein